VKEFQYGSPHPLSVDLRAGRHEAKKRAARCYVLKLSQANASLLSGSEEVTKGLALFDLESRNIRQWQSWAASVNEANPDDEVVAELCRDFARVGPEILELRAHPKEMIRWAMACLKACRGARCYSEASALVILGHASLTLGDPHKAIDYFERALTASRDIQDDRGEGVALDNLGLAYVAIGENRKAIDFHQRALDISYDLDDRFHECMTLGNMGNAAFAAGDYPQAIEYHERALALARETGHRISEGKSLGNLGLAVFASGDRFAGMRYYNDALVIAREIGNRSLEATIFSNMGDASIAAGNVAQAIQYHEEALHVFRETGNRLAEARILAGIGHGWASLGKSESAINCFEQSVEIARQIGDALGEGRTLFLFARAMHRCGQLDQAVALAERAVQVLEQIEHPLADSVRADLAKWRPPFNPERAVAVVLVRGPSADGIPIYAYVAVRSDRLVDLHEAEKRPAFFPDEYGVIIESGEGEPSEEVKQRMTREYGFRHQ
jgi:tetratricopeptide (TPR) repeat protein